MTRPARGHNRFRAAAVGSRRIATALPLGARAITSTRVQATEAKRREEARADTKKGSGSRKWLCFLINKLVVVVLSVIATRFISHTHTGSVVVG